MTPYKAGAVVLLPFPFTNLRTTKQRPAVVISSQAFNARQPDVVVMAITSQLPSALGPDEYRLGAQEQRAAGLPKPSMVKCGKLLTIDQRLIRKVLGHLPSTTVHQLTQRLLVILSERGAPATVAIE